MITGLDEETVENPELVQGGYLLETRKLDDISPFGGNSREDGLGLCGPQHEFSEITKGAYKNTLMQPAVRSMVTETSAELMRSHNTNRLRFGCSPTKTRCSA